VTERYPTLRAFARGYLHEDFEAEHGTPRAALEAFRAAATPAERRALAREAARLDRRITGWPIARVRDLLRDELGCAWWPARASEVRALLDEAISPSPRA
jgi:predicted NAD-dependent protein-ADP-ribosyltransferase YbiA (DUF1768 family)